MDRNLKLVGASEPDLAASGAAGHDPFALALELIVADRETVLELSSFAEGPARDEFALTALKIGVLALRQARGQIDAELIQRETQRMLDGMELKLGEHSRAVQDRLGASLKEYFDPESGRFSERVRRLVEKDGELERVLRAQIGSQDSELCKTLVAHFGVDSPLMKLLSPDDSQGVLAALREVVGEQLRQQRDRVLGEFSLDNKDGALSRLIKELSEKHGELAETLQTKIDEVVKEFSLDEDGSALCRLVKNVEGAQQTISKEFSLDNQGSAFSRLKQMLESTSSAIHSNLTLDDDGSSLSKLKRHLETILAAHCEVNTRFQEEVKIALAKMVVTRDATERSPHHGIAFEKAVCMMIEHQCQRFGDVADRTGERPGMIKYCKIGDCVVELGPESSAPGARIVVEAKEEDRYSLASARAEIEMARKNRDAQIGLFVFSRNTAPEGLEPFGRYGDDLFVVWDAEDATSDVYVKAALTTARALCIRRNRHSQTQAADFKAIDAALLEIEKRAEGIGEIAKWAETIDSSNKKILDRVRISREALERQVSILQVKLVDLRQSVGGGE